MPNRKPALLTESLQRWQKTASETMDLLQEADQLMDRRVDLYRRRRELFRELVQSARGFIENVPPH
jgi:hypothetical protein